MDKDNKQLEKLSQHLIPFEREKEETIEDLQETIAELESNIEELRSDVDNERERADIAVDEADQVRKDYDYLENKVHEVISWLSNVKKDQSIESIIEQLEWTLKPRSEDDEEY